MSRAGLDQQCPGPEQIGELFQAFLQAEISTSKKSGGTGLGLVLGRRFCQMMGWVRRR
jgi:signal transduction histidine kinase